MKSWKIELIRFQVKPVKCQNQSSIKKKVLSDHPQEILKISNNKIMSLNQRKMTLMKKC